MLYDEQLTRELATNGKEGVVRVYGWQPPCISLGYHQSLDVVNIEKCRREGVDVVRRPTGGRAVLHWEELTYSVVLKPNGESLSEVYRSIGLALERGLKLLNQEITLSRPEPRRPSSRQMFTSTPCYSSIARFEIQYRGRKLVGSAQRRYSIPQAGEEFKPQGRTEVVLQHGSILLGPAHRRLTEFLAIEDEEMLSTLGRELETKSIGLSSILRRPIGFKEVAECLHRGFEAEWGIQFC